MGQNVPGHMRADAVKICVQHRPDVTLRLQFPGKNAFIIVTFLYFRVAMATKGNMSNLFIYILPYLYEQFI